MKYSSIYVVNGKEALFDSPLQSCTMQDCVNHLQSIDLIAADTETEGLDFTGKKLLMIQVGDKDKQFVIDYRVTSKEDIALLKTVLEDDSKIKILHNAKFDYKFLKFYCNISLNNVYDTMLSEKVLHCGKDDYGFALGKLTQRYLNVTLNKEVRNRFVDLGSNPFTVDQMVYGAKDVEYLIDIYHKQQPDIEFKKLRSVVKLENLAVVVFSEIEYEGLILDTEAWQKLAVRNKAQSVVLEKELDKTLLADERFSRYKAHKQLDMFTDVEELKSSTVKWSSPTQVVKIFRTLVPELENANGKKLAPYRYKHVLIDEYIKYKEKDKLSSAFGDNFYSLLSADKKVRTNFTQILDTGRVSSSEPNMQQIPATNEYRNCFVAPEGYVFVSSDYSSQELNVIAYGSQDPVFLKALQNNEDLHSVCAELVFGDVWNKAADPDCDYVLRKEKCNCSAHKKLRTQVKTINFGLAYGMGPKKLSETINCSTKEAKELITKYFKAFPKIEAFLNGLGEFGKKHGYIETFPPFRRKRWFNSWTPKMYSDRDSFMELGSIERASKNTPIQGSSADMTKLALVLIHKHVKENNLPVKIIMTVHDQIDTICPREYAEEWKIVMTELMERAANTVIKNGLLKAETSITNVWSK
jgi:DNA polymerase-1